MIGTVNVVAGLYMFFNNDLLMLPVGVLVGICVLVHGLNIFMVAITILVAKSGFIMNKEEMLEQAAEEVEKAHEAAKEAIKAVSYTHLDVYKRQAIVTAVLILCAEPCPRKR